VAEKSLQPIQVAHPDVHDTELKVRAERRLGELIAWQKESVGLNRGRAGLSPIAVDVNDRDTRPTLADMGISKASNKGLPVLDSPPTLAEPVGQGTRASASLKPVLFALLHLYGRSWHDGIGDL